MITSPLAVAHLVFLGLWGGAVLVELVIELHARGMASREPVAAELHFWIDLLIELPLLLAVLVTGFALTARQPAFSGLLLAKIALGLTAILANLICVGVVIQRRREVRRGAGESRVAVLSRRVRLTAAPGLPAGLAALYLGFHLM